MRKLMLNPLIGGSLILMKRIKKFPSVKNPAMTVKTAVMLKTDYSGISNYMLIHRHTKTLSKALRVKVKNKKEPLWQLLIFSKPLAM